MKRSLWAALACWGCVAGETIEAAEPSLCERLADEARRLPVSAWDKDEPLGRWILPSRPAGRQPSRTERALANDVRWQDKVTAPSAQHIGVQHLQGTPVYLLDFVSGTAHCQQYVLAEVRAGQPPQELESPLPTTGLCMGGWARLAWVMNRPALVAGEAPSAGAAEGHYDIAAWTGKGWGLACRLNLRLRTQLTPTLRFCAPGSAVCEAGKAAALGLAMGSEGEGAADVDATVQGQPDDEVIAALNSPLPDPGAVGDSNLPLPTFGAKDPSRNGFLMQFSSWDPARLPVFIDGRWWLAVVGRGGIGWRKGNAVNVALFAPPGRAADAMASYQFGFVQTGLLDATVTYVLR